MNAAAKPHGTGIRRVLLGCGVWLLASSTGACGARSGIELGRSGSGGDATIGGGNGGRTPIGGGASSGSNAGGSTGGVGTAGFANGGAEHAGAANAGATNAGTANGGTAGEGNGGAVTGGATDGGAAGGASDPILITDIAAKAERTCALFSDGSVKCWGSNYAGVLGYGTKTNVLEPALVGPVRVSESPGVTVTRLGGGPSQNCALLSTGSATCWGNGDYGQLGYGNTKTIGDDELPSSVGPVSITTTPGITVRTVEGGDIHTCALLSDGSIRCWGSRCCNGAGNADTIGDDELPSSVGPVSITTASGITSTALVANGTYTCALLSNDSVKCWGLSNLGQLGYGNTDAIGYGVLPSSVGPVSVTSTSGVTVTQLAAGYAHVCALLSDGSVKCWGWNRFGQLGYGNTKTIGDDELPASVGTVSITTNANVTVKQLAAGGRHTCALLSDGTVRCWGDDNFGQLGYGNTNVIGDDELPSSVGPVSVTTTPGVTIQRLSAGDYHTCAVLSDGSAKCWGWNHDGQLGYGNTENIGDDELPSSVGPVEH